MHKVNWKLNSKLEKAGSLIVQLLAKKGFQGFFVGGAVRDKMMKRASNNLDIATDALPDEVEKVLEGANIHFKRVGKIYGTILCILNNQQIEITTFRREGRYSDKRHPDHVEFIREYLDDAKRRDLTINALYLNPITKQLLDPASGHMDLKRKLIKFVGDPKKRIDEDALRMLRAVRLATTLGFKIEKNSFAAIKTRAKYIQEVSGERIKQEFDKILISKNRSLGVKLMDEIGLLRFIIPETQALKGFSHKSKMYHLEGDMFTHTMKVLENVRISNLTLLYAALFHDIGKPLVGKRVKKDEGFVISTKGHGQVSADIFLKFAERLKFPRAERDLSEWIIRNHSFQVTFPELNIKKQLELAEHDGFELLLEHWHADEFGNKRANFNDAHHKRYLISEKFGKKLKKRIVLSKNKFKELANGDLIMRETNLAPGVKIKEIMDDIKVKILSDEIKNLSDTRNFLKKFTKNP